MKNYIIKAGLFVVLAASFGGCKKDIDERFLNPEQFTVKSIPGFFTAMLNNDRVAAKYWNVRTFLSLMPGTYAQTGFFSNGNAAYQQSDSYSQQYWDDFYSPGGNGSGPMAQYRNMETVYNAAAEADKASQTIFMQAAKVVLIEQAAKMVDLWGDIPYSETGSLVTNSVIIYPRFDDQKVLYTQFIADLDAANTYFKTAKTTPEFSKYDILLSGDVSKWQRYANSLRLRLLMRISNSDENTAKTAILAMLNAPASYPLVDGIKVDAVYNPKTSDILLSALTNNTSTLIDAYREGSWYATDFMLNKVLLPSNDPRIPVLYDKNSKMVKKVLVQNPTYQAMPYNFTTNEQENNYDNYAVVDSATFFQNVALPGIIITASEVNLLKAEAFERWGNTTDAKTSYDLALRQSITFYYYLNNLNTSGVKTETMPSATVIDEFINSSTATYPASTAARLASIYTQKWLHYGLLQSTEAWSEYRRTGYPALQFVTTGKLSGYDVPPNRLIYPSNEKTYNGANYAAVQAKDTRLTKIFWDVN